MEMFDVGDIVPPPWVRYPGSEPTWGGWRQGESEAWLRDTWFPYWQGLSQQQRAAYLKQWPPPDGSWQLYVTQIWS
jgi:hypothetical protein